MAEPTQVQQIQQGFAPEIAPYAQTALGQLAGLTYNYALDASGNPILDASGQPQITGFKQAELYPGERQAKFTALQQAAQANVAGMQPSPQLQSATNIAGAAATNLGQTAYTPGQFTNQFNAPSTLGYAPAQSTAATAGLASLAGAQGASAANLSYAPTMQGQTATAQQAAAAPTTQAQGATAARLSTAPTATAAQAAGPSQVTTQDWTQPGTAAAYMSPYQQNVIDIQQREAQRAADVATTGRHSEQVKQGAFGGSRGAVMDAEAARNLALQKGDIQAQGTQAAYASGQAQFNAQQQAALAAQQANQGAGVTVGGQNLSAAQQTALANQAQASQYGLTQGQMEQAAGLQTSSQAQQAALANQAQAGQYGLANLNAAQQAAMQTSSQAQQAAATNQATASQYGLTQAQMEQAAGLQTSAQAQQAAMANAASQNQMAQYNAGLQQQTAQANTAAQNQAAQFGSGQALSAAGTSAQYGQAANQLGEQSQQFGAGLNLQGQQAAIQGASTLGTLGQQEFAQGVNINQLQQQTGATQQAQTQQGLSQQYQDFLNQQNLPYKQVGLMADMTSKLPTSTTSSTMFQAPPSTVSQAAGLGTAALGLSKLVAKGGAIKEKKRPAGLSALALSKMA